MSRILVSNGRSPITLNFIRLLARHNHEVYVTETNNFHLSRFSNCVKKCFTIPSPRFSPQKHIEALIAITQVHKIDLLIPGWEDAILISKHMHEFPCPVFTSNYSLLEKLHHKGLFIRLLEELNFKTPKTLWIPSNEALQQIPLHQYALKACYSRSSQHVFKITPHTPLPNI